tara:strand:+ start:221 stop:442 length:222 start_codon:yes stop_codon:yes gene_type:complete
MFNQCLPFLIKLPTFCYTSGIGLDILCKFRSLDDFPVDFGGGALMPNRALLAGFGFLLFKGIVPGFIMGLIGS